jgi:hypothetical protein
MNIRSTVLLLTLTLISVARLATAEPVTVTLDYDGSGNGPAGQGILVYDADLPPRERILEWSWDFGGVAGGLDPSSVVGLPEELIDIIFGAQIITRVTTGLVLGPFDEAVFCGAANTSPGFCPVYGAPAYRITGSDGTEYSGFVAVSFSGTFVYDVAADWSDEENPSGLWSYFGDNYELLTINQTSWDAAGTIANTSQRAWADATLPNPGHVPMWMKSSGPSTLDMPGVGMHGSEGSNSSWVAVMWTCPANGTVNISGGVWQALKTVNDGLGGNHQNRNSDWRLRLNGTILASGNVSGTDSYSSANPFTFTEGAGGSSLEDIVVQQGDLLFLEFISPTSFATFNGIDLVITANGFETNDQPTADAGPDQSGRVGDTVFLDGSGSSDDNTPTEELGYQWTMLSVPAGSAATLTGADTIAPIFVVDAPGFYTVQLVVTDEEGLPSQADIVQISSLNMAPTAEAGPDQLVLSGSLVVLDGSGSTDPEGDPLTYEWSFINSPEAGDPPLSDPTGAVTTFVALFDGQYEVQLDVADAIGPGEPDTVIITAGTGADVSVAFVLEANNIVSQLGPDQVTSENQQAILTRVLSRIVTNIQAGRTRLAYRMLRFPIVRTDGCVERGEPDARGRFRRDWVTDCAAQEALYQSLTSARDAINP